MSCQVTSAGQRLVITTNFLLAFGQLTRNNQGHKKLCGKFQSENKSDSFVISQNSNVDCLSFKT